MHSLRFAIIVAGAFAIANAASAGPRLRGAKVHRTMSPAVEEMAKDSYYVPYVTGAGGRKYPIMDVPGSATVVARKLMDDQQAITLGDALRNVSGVTVRGR